MYIPSTKHHTSLLGNFDILWSYSCFNLQQKNLTKKPSPLPARHQSILLWACRLKTTMEFCLEDGMEVKTQLSFKPSLKLGILAAHGNMWQIIITMDYGLRSIYRHLQMMSAFVARWGMCRTCWGIQLVHYLPRLFSIQCFKNDTWHAENAAVSGQISISYQPGFPWKERDSRN